MSAPRIRFVLGGVQKAGTTALARYLGMHPRLRLPSGKEAHVFDAPDFDERWSAMDVDRRYATHFDDGDDRRPVLHGDATPIYLLHPRFVERIARYNPAMRWIVLLRDPVERAISHYHMERARGEEHWSFWPAMLLEHWRLRRHRNDFRTQSPLRRHSYRLRGDYARQLDILLAHFPGEQVLLLTNRMLRDDPDATVELACSFLGIEPMAGSLQPEHVFEGNYAPRSRNAVRMRLLRWLMRRELRALRKRHGITFD